MKLRRVITGPNPAGHSEVLLDAVAPSTHEFEHLPGSALTRLWCTTDGDTLYTPDDEPTTLRGPLVPAAGESAFVVMTFGPDLANEAPEFDPVRAAAEFGEYLPDLSAAMEPDAPGMHATDSLDYVIVLDGEVWLELDDGVQIHLATGDVVVQIGSRHAWRNKSSRPVTLAIVMVGAQRIAIS